MPCSLNSKRRHPIRPSSTDSMARSSILLTMCRQTLMSIWLGLIPESRQRRRSLLSRSSPNRRQLLSLVSSALMRKRRRRTAKPPKSPRVKLNPQHLSHHRHSRSQSRHKLIRLRQKSRSLPPMSKCSLKQRRLRPLHLPGPRLIQTQTKMRKIRLRRDKPMSRHRKSSSKLSSIRL